MCGLSFYCILFAVDTLNSGSAVAVILACYVCFLSFYCILFAVGTLNSSGAVAVILACYVCGLSLGGNIATFTLNSGGAITVIGAGAGNIFVNNMVALGVGTNHIVGAIGVGNQLGGLMSASGSCFLDGNSLGFDVLTGKCVSAICALVGSEGCGTRSLCFEGYGKNITCHIISIICAGNTKTNFSVGVCLFNCGAAATYNTTSGAKADVFGILGIAAYNGYALQQCGIESKASGKGLYFHGIVTQRHSKCIANIYFCLLNCQCNIGCAVRCIGSYSKNRNNHHYTEQNRKQFLHHFHIISSLVFTLNSI